MHEEGSTMSFKSGAEVILEMRYVVKLVNNPARCVAKTCFILRLTRVETPHKSCNQVWFKMSLNPKTTAA